MRQHDDTHPDTMSNRMWQHLWPRIELAIRAAIADRLTQGPSVSVDQALMARVQERAQIQRAGWFD